MKIYSLLVVFFTMSAFSQAPAIEWQKAYGGNEYDFENNLLATSDGGYILSGWSYSNISGDKTTNVFGSYDYWVVKVDSLGAIEWQQSLGGDEGDSPLPIIETPDGGFLVGGNSISNISGNKNQDTKGFDDIWIVKLNDVGEIQWQQDIGGNANDWIFSINSTPDGGFLLGGTSYSGISGDKSQNNIGGNNGTPDYWIIKINNVGTIEWEKTIGSISSDYVDSILNVSDGGYLITGYSNGNISGDKTENSKGGYDCWILKLDDNGNILWQKTIGGDLKDQVRQAISTSDGNYLIGTFSRSNQSGNKTENSKGEDDLWLVKIDTSGNILWDKTIGGLGTEELYTISEDNLGNCYIGARSNSDISGDKTENSRGSYDYWVVKITNEGNLIWDKTIGGTESEFNTSLRYLPTDDSVIVGGSSYSSISGDKTAVSRGFSDYWVVKLTSDQLSSQNFTGSAVSVYPNPTAKTIHVHLPQICKTASVSITTVTGQVIHSKALDNIAGFDLDIDGEAGLYFLNLTTENNEKQTFKVIKK